ncbi:HAD-IA family hydrolase [Rathayibacter sp. VKM Ac-2835]|uniref:HAD-IA family hydrolase n=1 Tax=Rathayibacter sp. VKM Ac-2835 TaxID=2739043 RepID=UPI001563DF14|nr:HAD-IA family hydrolase [Rathayibacter sp. VKM Ac-2835]NRG43041.1 HAD-IA family hydrolase [Rathayibacter sp. VKM Ac-2835]
MINDSAVEVAAVLFDMDGTLVDSTAFVERLWTSFANTFNLDAEEVIRRSRGRQIVDTVSEFLPQLPDEHRRSIVAGLMREEADNVTGILEIPHAQHAMAKLMESGIPVALVTSAVRELAVARMRAAAVPMPPVVVSAEDVGRGKPAPDGYLLAAELLGVDVAACVVFEDAEAGIASGLNAGAQTVVVGEHSSSATTRLGRLRDWSTLRVQRARIVSVRPSWILLWNDDSPSGSKAT